MAIYRKSLLTGILLSCSTGCTFFEQPVTDLRDLTPSAPAGEVNSPAPPVATTPTTSAPATTPTTTTTASTGASYLVVTPIENLPENARNIAVVHFTKKDTDRAVALCKALTQNLQIVDLAELPAIASTVALWPVANDNAGGTCIEMLTDYEPIDITVEAAKRVNESSDGPFLLTQHMESGKRMIFDMSFTSQNALNSAVGKWTSMMGSDPANWPAYRRAR